MIVWVTIKLAGIGFICAGFAGLATIWIACFFAAIAGIRRPKGIVLMLIYTLCACVFGWLAFSIAQHALDSASSGQAKFFAAMTAFYFFVLITRRTALPVFLGIARRQIVEWNSAK